LSNILNGGLIEPFALGLYVTIIAITFKKWVVFSGDVDVDAGARIDIARRRGAMTARIKRPG
jgi:hypothetical protein